METIFCGYFKECFADFVGRIDTIIPPGAKIRNTVYRPIAQFCGAEYHRVAHWFSGRATPMGEMTFKLSVFLELQGYQITERERIEAIRRNFQNLVAYSICTVKEMTDLVEISNTNHIFGYLRQEDNLSEDRRQKIWNLWAGKRQELDEAKQQAEERFGNILEKIETIARAHPSIGIGLQRVETKSVTPPQPQKMVDGIDTLVHFLKGTASLIDTMSFDSQEEIAALRVCATNPIDYLKTKLDELTERIKRQPAQRAEEEK